MLSFYVNFISTNISIINTLYIIKNCVNGTGRSTMKTATSQGKFLDLFNLVLSTSWSIFSSHLYQQTDRLTEIFSPSRNLHAASQQTVVFMAIDSPKVLEQFVFFVFFYLGFLLRKCTNHRTAEEGGGHFFNSSLPLPPASQTLRHQPGDYCRELTSAHSQQPDSNQEPLVSERKSLNIRT